MERALHARSCRAAATGGQKEMVSRSTTIHVAKEEKSTEVGTRGMERRFVREMVAVVRGGGHEEENREKMG